MKIITHVLKNRVKSRKGVVDVGGVVVTNLNELGRNGSDEVMLKTVLCNVV